MVPAPTQNVLFVLMGVKVVLPNVKLLLLMLPNVPNVMIELNNSEDTSLKPMEVFATTVTILDVTLVLRPPLTRVANVLPILE
jgi:hypothetical protein